jgi:hypothetical protein
MCKEERGKAAKGMDGISGSSTIWEGRKGGDWVAVVGIQAVRFSGKGTRRKKEEIDVRRSDMFGFKPGGRDDLDEKT